MNYRASIERGEILTVETDEYTVKSLDREGIETPPISTIYDDNYTVGDMVYFFFFPDGTGKILCKVK